MSLNVVLSDSYMTSHPESSTCFLRMAGRVRVDGGGPRYWGATSPPWWSCGGLWAPVTLLGGPPSLGSPSPPPHMTSSPWLPYTGVRLLTHLLVGCFSCISARFGINYVVRSCSCSLLWCVLGKSGYIIMHGVSKIVFLQMCR